MTEQQLIQALTALCEQCKQDNNGFGWLTHTGRPASPVVIAVFEHEAQRIAALKSGWDEVFSQRLDAHLAGLDCRVKSIRFDSEQACTQISNGNWERHLQRKPH